jgi:hypothetical protein
MNTLSTDAFVSFASLYRVQDIIFDAFRGFFWFRNMVGAFGASLQSRISSRTLAFLRILLVLIRVLDKSFLAPFGHLAVSACRCAVRQWWGEAAVHQLLGQTRRPVQSPSAIWAEVPLSFPRTQLCHAFTPTSAPHYSVLEN